MKPKRLTAAQLVCRHMPPLIGQRLRAWLYPQASAFADDYEFVTTAQTGSSFCSRTGEFHAYPFAVYGYHNWRAWAIALAVCSEGDTIIEVGANVGTETVGFADIVGCNGQIHAFEPLPSNLNALYANARMHRCSNIVIYPMALSDAPSKVYFEIPKSKHASGSGHLALGEPSKSPTRILVDCTSLDAIQESFDRVTLVFMDAEGAEMSILKGGEQFYKKFQPITVVEAGARQLSYVGLELSDLYKQIIALDYLPFAITRLGLQLVDSKHFPSKTQDWLCVPVYKVNIVVPSVIRYLRLCGLLPCIPHVNPLSRFT